MVPIPKLTLDPTNPAVGGVAGGISYGYSRTNTLMEEMSTTETVADTTTVYFDVPARQRVSFLLLLWAPAILHTHSVPLAATVCQLPVNV